jgi:PAS domain-containing protein
MTMLFGEADYVTSATAAFGAAAPVVLWVVRKLFGRLDRIISGFESVGEKVDQVSDRVEKLEPVVARLATEVAPNGGSSLRDAIDAIERRVTILAGQHRARFEGDGLATYECDAEGQCTYASVALADMYGMTPDQFLGSGWLMAVDGPGERERVWDAWLSAIKRGIPYEDSYMVVVGKEKRKVRTYTRAVRDKTGKALCYFGIVTPADPGSKLFPPTSKPTTGTAEGVG